MEKVAGCRIAVRSEIEKAFQARYKKRPASKGGPDENG
jgi:hypothetical protein